MNDDFIPLLPPAPPPSAPTPAFAPAASPAPAASAPTGSNVTAPAHQPRLTVRQAGDRITHIIVQCTCGEQIELACEHTT